MIKMLPFIGFFITTYESIQQSWENWRSSSSQPRTSHIPKESHEEEEDQKSYEGEDKEGEEEEVGSKDQEDEDVKVEGIELSQK